MIIIMQLIKIIIFFQAYEEGPLPDYPNLDESYYMGFNLLNWMSYYWSKAVAKKLQNIKYLAKLFFLKKQLQKYAKQ